MGSTSGLKIQFTTCSICALAVYWIKTKEKNGLLFMKYLLINAIAKETTLKFNGFIAGD